MSNAPYNQQFSAGASGIGQVMRPVPFLARLGVKHGIVLAMLIMMAMTIITALQMRETLNEIERSAMDKGRTVAAAVAPMVRSYLGKSDEKKLAQYFKEIEQARDINYVQVVDNNGRIKISSDGEYDQPARPLFPGWVHRLGDKVKLDREAISVPWDDGRSGVDVFVSLADKSDLATPDEIEKADHLRIGVNFDGMVKKDTPRVIYRMAIFTLIVTLVMVIGLALLLAYILRPLRELHLGLRAVAAGDLNYQVPVLSHDEIGRLAQAFNATNARLSAAFQKIEELATRDPLTNLPNRRSFDERLAAEAARSRRYGHPFGLIMMDLDRFKLINDEYGHPAGDEVLRYIAKIIEANVRETDLPARVGGEEFAIILPESNQKEVRAVAEKLRGAVAMHDLPQKHGIPPGKRITISAGACCSSGHLVTPESMISIADAALYRSKNDGRDRVTMAPPSAGKTDMIERIEDESLPETKA
jgi:diguanylate cyclase (GGDEF)-like protein